MYSFTDTQEAADAMGMSLESFESMFGRLKDYGDTNNFVSSLEEGALKSEEIDDKLIDAQIKMGKLKASGANQSALDDQQAVIDNLVAQKLVLLRLYLTSKMVLLIVRFRISRMPKVLLTN